jgi:hypothetical protein
LAERPKIGYRGCRTQPSCLMRRRSVIQCNAASPLKRGVPDMCRAHSRVFNGRTRCLEPASRIKSPYSGIAACFSYLDIGSKNGAFIASRSSTYEISLNAPHSQIGHRRVQYFGDSRDIPAFRKIHMPEKDKIHRTRARTHHTPLKAPPPQAADASAHRDTTCEYQTDFCYPSGGGRCLHDGDRTLRRRGLSNRSVV